jgi:hypothetical protein
MGTEPSVRGPITEAGTPRWGARRVGSRIEGPRQTSFLARAHVGVRELGRRDRQATFGCIGGAWAAGILGMDQVGLAVTAVTSGQRFGASQHQNHHRAARQPLRTDLRLFISWLPPIGGVFG